MLNYSCNNYYGNYFSHFFVLYQRISSLLLKDLLEFLTAEGNLENIFSSHQENPSSVILSKLDRSNLKFAFETLNTQEQELVNYIIFRSIQYLKKCLMLQQLTQMTFFIN